MTRTIYLNRDGVSITRGWNDSRRDVSALALGPTDIAGWDTNETLWHETTVCLRNMFSRYDVTFVELDPSPAPHVEAVFGGHPSQFDRPATTGGLASLSTTCDIIENAMVFTFADVFVQRAQFVCETMAQEIAHAYGLDHTLLATDPMSYLPPIGKRTFQDEEAACGETTARPCGPSACSEMQNSHAMLLAQLGPGTGEIIELEPEPEPTPAPAPGCSTTEGSPFALLLIATLLLRRTPR